MIAAVCWVDTPGIPPIDLRELVELEPVSPPNFYRGSVTQTGVTLTVELTNDPIAKTAAVTVAIVATGIPESEDFLDIAVPEDICAMDTGQQEKIFTPLLDWRRVQIIA